MAGPWIKVEAATLEKPEVLRMARALGVDRDAVIGKLIRTWVWFDLNSTDGLVEGTVDADLDSFIGTDGFAKAMRDVNWLTSSTVGLQASEFHKHNSVTAKERALNSKKVSRYRKGDVHDDVHRDVHGEPLQVSISISNSFMHFWNAWPKHPRKVSKSLCWKKWLKLNLDPRAEEIIRHVEAMKRSADWMKEGGQFIPAPMVYLNQQRWDGAEITSASEPHIRPGSR